MIFIANALLGNETIAGACHRRAGHTKASAYYCICFHRMAPYGSWRSAFLPIQYTTRDADSHRFPSGNGINDVFG